MSCGGGAHIEKDFGEQRPYVGDEGHWGQSLTAKGFAVRLFPSGENLSVRHHYREVTIHVIVTPDAFDRIPIDRTLQLIEIDPLSPTGLK